jgi:hypothetical protein
MKGHVDKSMGIVTRMAEVLGRIRPTESLRLAKREACKKRNCSDSSGNSPSKILASQYTCILRLYTNHHVCRRTICLRNKHCSHEFERDTAFVLNKSVYVHWSRPARPHALTLNNRPETQHSRKHEPRSIRVFVDIHT